MITRQRTGFDAVAHLWRSFVCIDIGRPDTTAIPAAEHPAVIEDLGEPKPTDLALFEGLQQKRTWTQGATVDDIRGYLSVNGPQTVKSIGDAVGRTAPNVTVVLKRYRVVFRITEYRKVGSAKTAVWGLRPVEWKEN